MSNPTEWTLDREREVQRRVNMIRNCLHRKLHEYDENGNRRCVQCEAMVRPAGVPLLKQENRTLTNGFIQPLYGFHERMAGLPVPEPIIEQQVRYVTEWETL